MNDEQLAAISDKAYFNSWRALASFSVGGDVFERDGILAVRSGSPIAWMNIAFVTRRLDAPSEALAAAVAYFDGLDQPFIVRVREGVDPEAERASEALGIRYNDTLPGMTLHPIPDAPPPPPDLDIQTVETEGALGEFAGISAEAFGLPLEVLSQLVPMRFIESPGWEAYLGYVDGEAVAASMLQLDGEIAGVYFVGAREAYRKRGLGEAMTWHAVREGARSGCTVAALQASEMGRPIYERMGFRAVAGYRTFVRK